MPVQWYQIVCIHLCKPPSVSRLLAHHRDGAGWRVAERAAFGIVAVGRLDNPLAAADLAVGDEFGDIADEFGGVGDTMRHLSASHSFSARTGAPAPSPPRGAA